MQYLLENQTTNTDGSQTTVYLANSLMTGKYYTIYAEGTFNGATVTIEVSGTGDNFYTAGDKTTFTTPAAGNLWVNPGGWVRASLTDAGASTDINVVMS